MLRIQESLPLITDEGIKNIFYNYTLHEKKSFYVISKEHKGYEINRDVCNFVEDAAYLKSKYESGHTIVIKNMEIFNNAIREAAEELGPGTDVHMYLAPEDGDSFDWHTDERSVYVRVEKGMKLFALRYHTNEIVSDNYIKLKEGSVAFIRKGQPHRAFTMGPSVLLSFGIPDTNQEDS